MDFASVLRELAAYFEREDLRWAVVGGVALAAYGLGRTTLDLDFVVERDAQPQLLQHMEALGYKTLYQSPGYSNHQHEDVERGRVDFVYVGGETAEQLFGQVRERSGPGESSVRVPRPEHIAAMKIQAMADDPSRTAQEMADLRYLLTLPETDRQAIREQFLKRGLQERWDELRATD